MIPRSTEDSLPAAEPGGKVITWARRSFHSVLALLEETAGNLDALERGSSREAISVWHGDDPADPSASIPIEWRAEMLKRVYSSGVYYVRVRVDGVSCYYQCPALAAELERAEVNGPRSLEIAMSRAIDTTDAIHRIRSDDLKTELERHRTTRDLLTKSEDLVAVQARRITKLEEELEAAKEDNEPIFDDETSLKFLEVAQQYVTNPAGGASEKVFTELMSGVLGLLGSLETDAVIMGGIVKRHPEAWKRFQVCFNGVAQQSGQRPRLQGVREMAEIVEHQRPARTPARKAAPAAKKRSAATAR